MRSRLYPRLFLSFVLLAITAIPGEALGQRSYVLQGATIIDGIRNKPVKDRVIVVQNGMISGVGKRKEVIIPDGAKVINCKGKFIIPGLIDAHVHYESERGLKQMLAWGVVAANCMFESTEEARRIVELTRPDTSHLARIYPTAPIFTAKGGWWDEGFPSDTSLNRFPSTPEEARQQVRKARWAGMRHIKLMFDDMGWCRNPLPPFQKMKPEVMQALIEEARSQKMIAEVHAPMLADAKLAVDAGATALVHGILDDRGDPDFITAMLAKGTYYVPTFSLFEFLADVEGFMKKVLAEKRFRAALPPDVVKKYSSAEYYEQYRKRYPNIEFVRSHLGVLRGNAENFANNYVLVAMGTDMWALPGIGAHLELEYMVKAGLSPMQALASATTIGAQLIGNDEKIGAIEAGRWANMIILNADPMKDIRNTRNIRSVIKRGKIFDHQALVEESKR